MDADKLVFILVLILLILTIAFTIYYYRVVYNPLSIST